MRIERTFGEPENVVRTIGQLEGGDLFRYEDAVFMRTDTIGGEYVTCVRMRDGWTQVININIDVPELAGHLRWNYRKETL